jgi:hypothetical protein
MFGTAGGWGKGDRAAILCLVLLVVLDKSFSKP